MDILDGAIRRYGHHMPQKSGTTDVARVSDPSKYVGREGRTGIWEKLRGIEQSDAIRPAC